MKSSFRISVVISTVLTLGAASPYNFQHNPGYYNEQWRTQPEGRPHFYPAPVHEFPVRNYHQTPEQAPVYPRPEAYPQAQHYPHQANSFTTGGVNYPPEDLSHVPNFKTFFIPRSEHPAEYHLPINRPDSSNVKIIHMNSKDGTFDDEISDIVKDALDRARAVSPSLKPDQSESDTQATATAQAQATIVANGQRKPKNRDPVQGVPKRRPIFRPQKLPVKTVHKIPLNHNPAKTTVIATNEAGDKIASTGQDDPVPAKRIIPRKPTPSWGRHLPGPIQHKPLSEVLDVIAKQIANRNSKNKVPDDSAAVSTVALDVAVFMSGTDNTAPTIPDYVLLDPKTANPLPSTDDSKKPKTISDFANSSVLDKKKVGYDNKSTFAPVTEAVPVSGADNTVPAVPDNKLTDPKTAKHLPSTEDTNKPAPITNVANSSLLDKKKVGDDNKSTLAPVTEAVPVSGADKTTPTVPDDKITAPKTTNPLISTEDFNKPAPITNVANSPPIDKKKVGDDINNDDKSNPLTPVDGGRKHSNPLILVSDDNDEHDKRNNPSEDTSPQSNDPQTRTEEPYFFTKPSDTLFFGIPKDFDDESNEKLSDASKKGELVKDQEVNKEIGNIEIVTMNADGKKQESTDIFDPKNDVKDKPIEKSAVEIDSGKDVVNTKTASKTDSDADVANTESTAKINSDEDIGNTNTDTKSTKPIKEVKPKKDLTKTEKVTPVKTKDIKDKTVEKLNETKTIEKLKVTITDLDKTQEKVYPKEIRSEKDLNKTDKGTADDVTDLDKTIEKMNPKKVKSEKDDEITKDTYADLDLNKTKEKIDPKEVKSEKNLTDTGTAGDVTDLDKTIEKIDPKEVKSQNDDEISKDTYADIDLNKTKEKTEPKEVVSERDKTKPDEVTGDTDVTDLDKVKQKIDPIKLKSENKNTKADEVTDDIDLNKTNDKIVPKEVVSEIDVRKTDEVTEDTDAVTDLDKTKEIIDPKEVKSQNDQKKTDEITASKDVETKTAEKQKKPIIGSDNKKKEVAEEVTDVVANIKAETNINDSDETPCVAEENTDADTKKETETAALDKDDIEIKDDVTAVKAKDPEEAIVITVDGVAITKEDDDVAITEKDSEPLTPVSFIFNLISNALKGVGSITKMFEDPSVKAFLKYYFPFFNSNSNNESENKE